MASLIEQLFNILEEETGCYKALLDMADNKKDVIIKGDTPSLQEITKKEQELAGRILRLEKNREQNINDICEVTNRKKEEMTIGELIEILTGEEKVRLEKINDELSDTLDQLMKKNHTNKLLINQSLEYVNFTMNAIQSMRSMPDTNTYQAKGNRYDSIDGSNFFDAKQ